MLRTGVDLHKRDLTVAAVDAAGRLVEAARLRTTRAAVGGYFAGLGADAEQRAAVEPTSTWYRLADHVRADHVRADHVRADHVRADHVRAAGVGLTPGHSKYVKAISYASYAKVKTDAVDAAAPARLLRSDPIPAAHMVSPERRAPRDLLRRRLVLVAKRTRCKNAVAGLLAQYNVATPAELPLLPRLQCALPAEQRVLLAARSKRPERQLLPTLTPGADVRRLLRIPGIGEVAAFTLHLGIDGIRRSPAARASFP